MSDTPVFLQVIAAFRDRISDITQDAGFHHDLGEAVYVDGLQPVPLDDEGQPRPGTVLVDPGDATTPDDTGQVRASTAMLEARFERTVSVIAVLPIPDKSQWLAWTEQVAQDLRRALFADQNAWRALGVKRIAQVSLEASWPQSGAGVLHIKTDFILHYVDR